MAYKIVNDEIVNYYDAHYARFKPLEVNNTFKDNGVFRIYRDVEKGLPDGKELCYIFIWHEDIGKDKDLRTCFAKEIFPSDVIQDANKYNIPYCFYNY